MISLSAIRANYRLVAIVLLFTTVLICQHTYFYVTYRSVGAFYRLSHAETPFKRLTESDLLHIPGSTKQFAAIDRVYLINLPYRVDRRIGSIGLFQTLDLDAYIVPAHGAHSSQVESRSHLTKHGVITTMELACWASHMQVWSEIAANRDDNSWTLIFEDDIDLEWDLVEILKSFPHDLWNTPDLIYLGYCGNPPGALLYNGTRNFRVHRAVYPSCTHAYAIQPRTASKLMQLLASPREAIDNSIVNLVRAGELVAFSIHPPLVLQQSLTSWRPSDVNPVLKSWSYRTRKQSNAIYEWWRGVESVSNLKDSTLARVDFLQADNWRRTNENDFWRSNGTNVSSTSHAPSREE